MDRLLRDPCIKHGRTYRVITYEYALNAGSHWGFSVSWRPVIVYYRLAQNFALRARRDAATYRPLQVKTGNIEAKSY